jgi:hypothetical protein
MGHLCLRVVQDRLDLSGGAELEDDDALLGPAGVPGGPVEDLVGHALADPGGGPPPAARQRVRRDVDPQGRPGGRVPVSQLNYHFGSKQGLILTLLEEENRRRLARQSAMYAEDAAL